MANNNNKGVSGNNVFIGGSGKDKINGGANNDILDGRAGSDSLNGNSGDDILIYGLAENAGATDIYTGGSGIDTVRIVLTQAEWMSAAVEYQLARYYQHLLTVKTNKKTGEVSNGSASDFTFDFSNGGKLTVQMMERLEITVDGVVVTNQDQPFIKNGPQAADVVEDGDSDASSITAQSANGSIDFFDLDLSDSHVVSVANPAGAYGALTANVSNTTLGDSQGTVAWNYQLDNAAVQFLAAGEQRTEVFTIRIADEDTPANFAETQVTITITGTNDAPVIGVANLAGAVTEIADNAAGENTVDLTSSGTMAFTDVDLIDTHTINVTAAAAGYRGVLTADVSNVSTGDGAGVVTWDFKVNDSALDDLAAGQILTQVYTVEIADGNGGTDSRDVTITITGTNDAPMIGVADLTGAVTEIADNAAGENTLDLTSSGSIAFTDVDLTDEHTVTVAPVGGGAGFRGALTATVSDASTGDGAGVVTWEFKVNDSALDDLAAGQILTQVYTVEIADGNGGTDSRDVTISINGSNDAPTVSAVSINAIEDGVPVTAAFDGDDVDSDDDGDSLGYSIIGSPANGLLTNNNNGTFSFDPGTGFQSLAEGEITTFALNYKGTDSHGAESNSGALTINVTGINDAPTLAAGAMAAWEDGPAETLNLATLGDDIDSDDDGNTLSYALANSSPAGIASISGTTLSFDPGNDFQYLGAGKSTSFDLQVTATDAHGAVANNTVTVTVNGENDAPDAVNDTGSLTVLAAPTPTTVVSWVDWTSATGSPDPNNSNNTLGQVNGTITVGSNTIGVTYSGEYFFTQTNGGTNYFTTPGAQPGDPAPFGGVGTYTSAAVSNGPSTSDIIALGKATTTRTLTFDEPVDNLFFAIVSMNNNGYVMDQDFSILSYGRGYFGIGAATAEALGNDQFRIKSETPGSINQTELHGVVGIEGSVKTLTWTSQADEFWNGFTVGTYGAASTATASGNVLANDTDVDVGDTLTVVAANSQTIVGNSVTLTLASGATVNVNKDGSYLYDENGAFTYLGQDQQADDSFTYTISDGNGGTDTATVTIQVTGINDAPVANPDSATVDEDSSVTISVLDNDTDVDNGDTKAIQSVTNGQNGTVTISGSDVVYTPAANFYGNDSFSYVMQDALGLTSTASVNVTVNPVNDGPVINFLKTTIANGSFESGLTDWSSSEINFIGDWQAADGTKMLDMNAEAGGGYVEQSLQTIVGAQYTVGFALSKNPGSPAGLETLRVSAAGSSQDYVFSQSNSTSNMNWSQQTFTFTANSTSTTLRLASADATGGNDAWGPALDNVRLLADISAYEDTATTIKGLSVSDVDAGSNPITVGLSVSEGTLTISGSGLSGDLNGNDGTLSITGSQANINAALANGLVYKGNQDYFGADTLSVTVNDQGNFGAGGNLSTAKNISINVVPVNDAPTITYQGLSIINPSFESANGANTAPASWATSQINYIGDWEAADGSKTLDLNAESGGGYVEQSLQTIAGAQYTVGFALSKNPGSPTGLETLRVTANGASAEQYAYSENNDANDMQWLYNTYTFTATGAETTLRFASADSAGGTDAWGPALDDIIAVAAAAGNATPINGLNISDIDAGANPVMLSISVNDGTLAFGGPGLTALDADGSDGSISYTGMLEDINAALLNGLIYTPNSDFDGWDMLTVELDDLGSTGGGSETDTQFVDIRVVGVPEVDLPS